MEHESLHRPPATVPSTPALALVPRPISSKHNPSAPPLSEASSRPQLAPVVSSSPSRNSSSDTPSSRSFQQPPSKRSATMNDTKKKKKKKKKSVSLNLFKSHNADDAGLSFWFHVRYLLLVRLLFVCILVSHLVFFALRRFFNFRHFAVWNYLVLTLSLFLSLICSLLSLFRTDDDHHEPPPLHTTALDLEQQPIGSSNPAPQPPSKFAIYLTNFVIPLYFISLTASLFSCALYWTTLFDNTEEPASYFRMLLHAAAPAIALLDFLVSLTMRFRFAYILYYALYNAIFAIFTWLMQQKLSQPPLYPFFDPDHSAFVTRVVVVCVCSLVAAIIVVLLSRVPQLSCFNPTVEHQHPDNKLSETSSEDNTHAHANLPKLHPHDVDDGEFAVEVLDENLLTFDVPASAKRTRNTTRDRSSLPLTSSTNGIKMSSSGRWRPSSARLVARLSGSSLGDLAVDDTGIFARSDSQKSNWTDVEASSVKTEDEYFAMPKAFENVGREREVVRLQPTHRTDSGGIVTSGSGTVGRVSRNSSGAFGRISRNGSTRARRSESGIIGDGRIVRSPSVASGVLSMHSQNGSQKSL